MGCCTRDESSLISMPRPVIMLGGWGICSWQLSRDAVRRPFPPCLFISIHIPELVELKGWYHAEIVMRHGVWLWVRPPTYSTSK